MNDQQLDQSDGAKKQVGTPQPKATERQLSPKPDNQMNRFNAALRKILSVPKKT
jgi:hypothetical protein